MVKLTLDWRLTLFTLFFAPLLLSLGFWQLSRADEKRALLLAWEQGQQNAALDVANLTGQSFSKHQKLRLEAELVDERYWLLEARIYKGQVGYEILVPAKLVSGEWFLVNRGWVKAHPDRRVLPNIVTPSGPHSLWGEVQLATQTALIDESKNPITTWPHRILEVNFDIMSRQLEQSLYPLILALAEDHPSAFVVQSNPINMPPSKHQGYAVQWFLMAGVLMILWVATNTNIISLVRAKFDAPKAP